MSVTQLDSGCCGEDLKTLRISRLGVLTLGLPLAVVCVVLRPALWLLARTSTGRVLLALAAANDRLVAEAAVSSRTKCRLSGALYAVSPRLSGFVFRHFNFLICLLASAGVAAGGYVLCRLLWTL
jgi:hypothetical protein